METSILNTKIIDFVRLLNEQAIEQLESNYKPYPVLSTSCYQYKVAGNGKKYTKIIMAHCDNYKNAPEVFPSPSVYCFIDNSNGDILKAETWSRPAKHARGNIFNENPIEGCGVYSPKYLTR